MSDADQGPVVRVRRRGAALFAANKFFHDRDFVVVDPPMLIPATALEVHIEPLAVDVQTAFGKAARERRFLHTSPEIVLKRLVAQGIDRVCAIGHVFRDGERTLQHLPEFTMIEWYRRGALYTEMYDDVVQLVACIDAAMAPFAAARRTNNRDVGRGIRRFEVAELFRTCAGIDLDEVMSNHCRGDVQALSTVVREKGVPLRPGADFDDAFFAVMERYIEPFIEKLGGLVAVERWPAPMAALARLDPDDERFALRFEVYAGGYEIANGYDELTDSHVQRRRFEDDQRRRAALQKILVPVDEVFLADLEKMPPTQGVALGFDRVLMWLLGVSDIQSVQTIAWR